MLAYDLDSLKFLVRWGEDLNLRPLPCQGMTHQSWRRNNRLNGYSILLLASLKYILSYLKSALGPV
jgi:hypothetical protein